MKNTINILNTTIFPSAFTALYILYSSCSQPCEPASFGKESNDALISIVNSIATDSIFKDLRHLTILRSPDKFDSIEVTEMHDFMLNRFVKLGCDTFTRSFPVAEHSRYKAPFNKNLYAVKQGNFPALAPVMVSAHWDAVEDTPGADDNASGFAALLEIARLLKGRTTERAVVFFMRTLEEEGLIGSMYHVEQNIHAPPHILVNFDLIAYTSDKQRTVPFSGIPEKGDFIMIASTYENKTAALHFCDVIDEYVPGLNYYSLTVSKNMENNQMLSNIWRSDHGSFWEKNQPGLFLTDMADFRNPNYHEPGDTIETLDLEFLTKVAAATAAFVYFESCGN